MSFDPRRMRIPWLAAALLVHPVIVFAAVMVDLGMGGELQLNLAQASSLVGLASLVFFVFEATWTPYATSFNHWFVGEEPVDLSRLVVETPPRAAIPSGV